MRNAGKEGKYGFRKGGPKGWAGPMEGHGRLLSWDVGRKESVTARGTKNHFQDIGIRKDLEF